MTTATSTKTPAAGDSPTTRPRRRRASTPAFDYAGTGKLLADDEIAFVVEVPSSRRTCYPHRVVVLKRSGTAACDGHCPVVMRWVKTSRPRYGRPPCPPCVHTTEALRLYHEHHGSPREHVDAELASRGVLEARAS